MRRAGGRHRPHLIRSFQAQPVPPGGWQESSRNPVPGGSPASRASWGGRPDLPRGRLSVQPGNHPRSPRWVPCLEEHVPALPGPPACRRLPGRRRAATVPVSCLPTCRPLLAAVVRRRGASPGVCAPSPLPRASSTRCTLTRSCA